MNRVVVLLIFVCSVLVTAAVAQKQASEKQRSTVTSSFEQASQKFLQAIRDQDVEAIKRFLPSDGVALGHEQPPTPLQTLLNELDQRRGFYCQLFDGDCLEREFERKFGYSGDPHLESTLDLLRKNAVTIKKEVFEDKEWWGTLELVRKEPRPATPTYTLHDFRLVSGNWMLQVIWSE